MSAARDYLLAVIADTHCGSTLGLCPPEGVEHDDGGSYVPSKAQRWLWACFTDYLEAVRAAAKGKRLIVFFNGDVVDGPGHHGTSESVSLNPGAQTYVAKRMADTVMALSPYKTYVVRGTTVHVGEGGCDEEDLAKYLKADREAGKHTWSTWHLVVELNGRRFDFQHHGRAGTRPWTRGSGLGALAFQVWAEHAEAGLRPPDVAFRSHRHVYGDSGTIARTRVIQTPAFMLKNSYAHKVAAESIASIGAMLCAVSAAGEITVTPKLYLPAPPTVRRVV